MEAWVVHAGFVVDKVALGLPFLYSAFTIIFQYHPRLYKRALLNGLMITII
jgi:hypothetical protein